MNMTEERVVITEQQLFDRLVKLETDKLTLAADIKQLKADAKFDEDMNPKGIDKEQLKLIGKAASLHAKANFEETKESADAVFAKYEELTSYNS